jgi:hypothetical protein
MKKLIKFFISGLMLIACPVLLHADQENGFDLRAELSYIKYEEPSIAVEEKGAMYGIYGAYNVRPKEDNPLKGFIDVYHLDAHADYGALDYDGSGTVNDIGNYMFEPRFWIGKDLPLGVNSRITPYAGIGYRFLYDDGGGNITTTGASGYDRRSQYLYAPVGMEAKIATHSDWQVGLTAEYDAFIRGWQDSYLSDVAGYADIHNTQRKGYGLRGSMMLEKHTPAFDIEIGPYIRYWNIGRSNIATSHGSAVTFTGFEPANKSTEIGGQAGVRF